MAKPFNQLIFMALILSMGDVVSAAEITKPWPDKLPNAHANDRFNRLFVTNVTFSPDDQQVAAAYYRPATNRPGTNWLAFTSQWNLKTGKRTINWTGIASMAFSPDGKTLAMGVHTRSREPGFRMWPQAKLALWRVGKKQPFNVMALPTQDARGLTQSGLNYPAATVFIGQRRLIGLNGEGLLVHWRISEDKDESPSFKVLDNIKSKLFHRGWNWGAPNTQLLWDTKTQRLKLSFTTTDRRPSKLRQIEWKVNLKDTAVDRISDKTTELPITKNSDGSIRGLPNNWLLRPVSANGKMQAIPQKDSIIHLIDAKDDKKTVIRVLRLDD